MLFFDKKTKPINTTLWVAIIIFAVFAIFQTTSAATGLNKQINYQAKLTNTLGVSVPNGNYDVVFKIYDAASAGTTLWTGTYTTANGNPIVVANGVFNVLLGSGTGNTLTLDFSTDSYYLGVQIGADAEMTPRKRLGATPQAFNANNLIGDGFIKLTGAPTGNNVAGGTVYINPSSSSAGYTLLGLAVNGAQKFKVDEAGNVTQAGTLTVNGNSILGDASTDTLTLTGTSVATPNNLNFDANTFFIDAVNNRVGIGTATPGIKLNVENGTIGVNGSNGFFYANNSNRSQIILNSAGSYGTIQNDAANTWSLGWRSSIADTVGTSVLAWNTTGNVGVGTTIPGQKLTVAGGLGIWTNSNADNITFYAATGGAGDVDHSLAIYGSGTLAVGDDNDNVSLSGGNLFIDQLTGNVGVGDITPAALFTVGNGDLFQINASGQITSGAWNGLTIAIAYGGTNATTIGSAGSVPYSTGSAYAFSAVGTAGQCLLSGAAGIPAWGSCGAMAIGNSVISATAGSILFAGAAGILQQDNANFFWDDVNNRLGVGTASPVEKLQVEGNIRSGTAYYGMTGQVGNDYNIISNGDQAYRVGLGTNDGTGNISFQTASLGVGNTERMRILANGNVGIGAIPGMKLDVSGGSIRTTNQLISTIATGTAPLAVSSTTLNTNLNADLLDGLSSASFMPINGGVNVNFDIASNNNTSDYSTAAIELRELNHGGAQTGAISESPRLSFHWGGRVASQIVMPTDGSIHIRNNPGTGYETLRAGTIYSNDVPVITSAGRAYPRRWDGGDLNFIWSGQGGQPTWLWGGADGANMYVYNPSNFSVNYATNAGNADTVDGLHIASLRQWNTWQFNHYSGSDGAEYATILYDTNNSGYYVDPSYNSNFGGTLAVGGNVGVGRASESSVRLSLLGPGSTSATYSAIFRDLYGNNNVIIRDDGYGWLRAASWAYGSDRRLKENIASLNYGLGTILALNPQKFDYITGMKNQLGFIAQEVQPIIPELVSTSEDGMLALQTDMLIPVMVNAIKEQQSEIINSKLEISNLVLKTDADVISLQQLQASIDTQLGVVQASLTALATVDTQQATKLTDLETLTTTLQGQLEALQLDAAQNTLDITDAQLAMTNLEMLLDVKTDKTDFNFGHFVAENLETGLLAIKVVDAQAATIGTAVICPAGKKADTGNQCTLDDAGADGKSIIINTTAVTSSANVFVTIKSKLSQQVMLMVTEVVAGTSFKVELVAPTTEDIVFGWWIVDAK